MDCWVTGICGRQWGVCPNASSACGKAGTGGGRGKIPAGGGKNGYSLHIAGNMDERR